MTPEEALEDIEKYLGTRYDNKVYKVLKLF